MMPRGRAVFSDAFRGPADSVDERTHGAQKNVGARDESLRVWSIALRANLNYVSRWLTPSAFFNLFQGCCGECVVRQVEDVEYLWTLQQLREVEASHSETYIQNRAAVRSQQAS